MYPAPNFLTLSTIHGTNNKTSEILDRSQKNTDAQAQLKQDNDPLISTGLCGNILDEISEDYRDIIAESVEILRSTSDAFVTVDKIALLKKANAHAKFFAKGWLALHEQARSSDALDLINSFEDLLLSSGECAEEVGTFLGLSLTFCRKSLIEALSLDFYINLIAQTQTCHRAALIAGLTDIYLSSFALNQEKALQLQATSHIAREFGSFWYYLANNHPALANEQYFNVMIEKPASVRILNKLKESPLFKFFISIGFFERFIKNPARCEETINIYCKTANGLLNSLTNCLKKNPQDTHPKLIEIIEILYQDNVLCHETAHYLENVRTESIKALHQGTTILSSHLTTQAFGLLCVSRSNTINLSRELLRIARNETLPLLVFYQEELHIVINKLKESIANKNHIFNKCQKILELSETSELPKVFAILEKVIYEKDSTFNEKLLKIETMSMTTSSSDLSIIDTAAPVNFTAALAQSGLKRRASCANLV